MENAESVLLDLEEFNRSKEDDKQIPQSLENFIEYVSKTGTYVFPWCKIKKLYMTKLRSILNNLSNTVSQQQQQLNITNDTSLNTSNLNSYLSNAANESNSIQVIKDRIMERMESFNNAPFTIQRISELLLKPNSHYNRTDKFLRGLEKCVMVVSTIDSSGNKIFIETVYDNMDKAEEEQASVTPVKPATPEPVAQESNEESMVITTNAE